MSNFNEIWKNLVKTLFIDTFLFIISLIDYIPELFLSQREKENRLKAKSILVRFR
jgi:hypothetical protein